MSPVGLSPTRGVPFALSGKDSGTGALYGLTGANAQASCSRTPGGLCGGDLPAHVDVLCQGWLGVSELVGDGAGGQPCVVEQRGCCLTEDVARDPWQTTPSQAFAQVPLGVGGVA